MGSARLLPAQCSATQPSGAGVAAALTPSWGWLHGTPTGNPVLEGPGLPHGKRASAAAQNHVQATGRGAGGSRTAPRRKEGWGEWWPSDGQLATRMGASPPAACHSSETFGCEPQSLGIGILEPISRDKKHLSSESGWFLTGLAHGRTTPGPELMLWHSECPSMRRSPSRGGLGAAQRGWWGGRTQSHPAATKGPASPAPSKGWSTGPRAPRPASHRNTTQASQTSTQPQSRLCSHNPKAGCAGPVLPCIVQVTGTPQARPARRQSPKALSTRTVLQEALSRSH